MLKFCGQVAVLWTILLFVSLFFYCLLGGMPFWSVIACASGTNLVKTIICELFHYWLNRKEGKSQNVNITKRLEKHIRKVA